MSYRHLEFRVFASDILSVEKNASGEVKACSSHATWAEALDALGVYLDGYAYITITEGVHAWRV